VLHKQQAMSHYQLAGNEPLSTRNYVAELLN